MPTGLIVRPQSSVFWKGHRRFFASGQGDAGPDRQNEGDRDAAGDLHAERQ
jgi:hypothetical protein